MLAIQYQHEGNSWGGGHEPFATLEITDGVWKDKTVARTNRLDNTAGYVILSTTGVRLVHSMELATTALDLERIRPGCLKAKIHLHLSHKGYWQCDGYTVSLRQNMTIRIQVLDPQFDGSST